MKKIIFLTVLTLISFMAHSQIQSLAEPNLDDFKVLAEKKADQFRLYLIKISSKSTSLSDKQTAISQACGLFISDTVFIQISYCNSEKSIYSKKLINYLKKLSQLNYDNVSIEWVECAMVEELHKGVDGNYYGIISFLQKFTAQKGEKVYSDITRKHMEVVLKPYKKPDEMAEDQWRFEVFLSNVSIKEPCL